MERPLRVLVITRLFPNAVEPLAAAFNRQQFAALGKICDLRVMATIPWFPAARFVERSKVSKLAKVPARDVIAGLDVRHPRVAYVPGVPGLSGALEIASLLPSFVREFRRSIDVILGSWAYPEGAAAIALARLAGVPAVVKAHGTDLNVIGEMPGPRVNLAIALPRAARVVVVSKALGEQMVKLGARPESVAIVANGTDASLFYVRDREEARRELPWPGGWPKRVVLNVGRVERAKGTLDLIEAFLRIKDRDPDMALAIIGDGSAMAEAKAAAAPAGDRIRFLGGLPLAEVTKWMAASTLVTLPSHAEGSPNVIREALACGRPVVGTNVGGIPELVEPEVGALVTPHDHAELGDALLTVAGRTFDPQAVRAKSGGSWEESASSLLRVLRSAVDEHGRTASANRG